MSERLSGAIEELEIQLQEQLQEVSSTKKLINSLLKRMGKEARYQDTNVESIGPARKDMYYGKPLATAVQMVLERMGQAATAADILKSLEEGAFDFRPLKWADNTKLRNVAISMAKNTKAFHKLPNGTFGLVSWYDAATINASKREKPEKAGDVEPDLPDGENSDDKTSV
jgi:hypothetical protein